MARASIVLLPHIVYSFKTVFKCFFQNTSMCWPFGKCFAYVVIALITPPAVGEAEF